MDTVFFHPKVVHVPLALGALMPIIAGSLILAWWRNWLPWRAWVMAIGLQTVLVLSGVVALRSGEGEEHRVEQVVSKGLIYAHEEAAEAFVFAGGAVLALMLLAAALANRRTGLPTAAVATLGTLVTFALGYRTGQAGGSLVYEHGAAKAYSDTSASSGNESGAKEPKDKSRVRDRKHRDDDDD